LYGVVLIILPLILSIYCKKERWELTFSKFDEHSSPLFKQTKIIKFHDLVVFLMAIFMHKYHSNLLPITFENFFVRVNEVHNYNTRLSSKISYSIPGVRTNYGKFNIRFQGVKVWIDIDENLKYLSPWHIVCLSS
jgi:hypothetical protein